MIGKKEHIIPPPLDGPYTSETFTSIWSEHFAKDLETLNVECFKGISFYKKGRLPIYSNVGATNTKGIHYNIDSLAMTVTDDNKVYLIHDVPDFAPLHKQRSNGLRLMTIPQYKGYICNLNNKSCAEGYLVSNLSSRSRSKLNNYRNKLKKEFSVSYQLVWGDISEKEYDGLFKKFHELLIRRYDEKQIVNNNLDPTEWSFFKDVTLPMMRNKEAGLFVGSVNGNPITITLLNFSKDHVYDVIRVFDIDFSQYRIGSLGIIEQIDWCIKNNFKVLDFSKGHFDYKERWSNVSYMFNYHIWYNPKSLISWGIANLLVAKFKLKYWARKQGILKSLHKIRYRLGHKPQ
ncbi:MAG: GNAT family N-acetyltransferase [Algicola sp.]|nr:GNAT family N-acetyltransferase [Algicola sp.]